MNEDIITSEEDLSRNKTDNNPVMDNVENSEQTATNPTPKRNPNVFDELSEFHTYEGQLNEGLQDALDLEKEYYTPQAGWGESTYDKEVRNKYQIEHGDLNDIRAEQQSGIAQITNGIGKSLVLTGTTALDGTIGTLWGFGQGIANAFSDDPNKTFWNGFVNNGFTNSMRDVEQFFDKYMPNYVGTAESKLGGFEAMGTANFWADQIKQIGFTAGTALGATVTGLITGGSGVLPKLAGNFGKILGMGTKGVNWMERLGLSMMSGFNETKNVVSGNTENRFNEYNRDNFNEYQQKLKDLDDRVINETYKRLYDLGYYKKKPEGIPTVIPRQEVIDQYKALVAKEIQGEYDALKAEYEEKSKDPMQRTVAAGSLELGVGTLFMTAMNMMGQMSVLPSPFTNAERMVNGSFTNKFARAANFITRKNKFSKDAFNEFKNISKGELAVKKLSEGISEMVEEGGQDIVTDFATIYYGSDNLQGSKTAAARAADAFMQSVDKNVNGESMYKDMQGAFLSTLIGTPIINKGASQNGKKDRTFTWQGGVVQMYKDASEEYKKSKETYDFIKDIINSPERRTAFNLNVFANTQKNKMMEAAAAADEKKWRDASDNISLKTIEAFASIGRLSDLKALTKDYENITDEQLEALAIGLSTKGEDGKYASENGATDENGELITNTEEGREKFKQNLIDNANKFNKMIDNYMDNFNSVDKLTGYQLNRDDLSMLTWGLTQADNWDERIKSMSNTIKEKYGVVLDKIIGSLQKELDDKQKYEQELNTLIAQDKENPSEDLKNRIKEVQSLIDPDLDENTYKTVLNVYDKLRNIDLDNTEKIGLWNQFIGDDFNMFTTTRDLLKGFSDDEISQIDKHDFLQLLDDIRKCNNSKHNVTNVVNQLIKNPEEIKRLRDEFIEKEERDIMSDSIDSVLEDLEQTTSETNEEPTISDAESILKELSEKLKDPKQLAKAVTEIANKNNQLKQLFQELEKKLKEKNAIDNIGDNILQNDLLPASINNPENKELIERFIKDFLQYLINEYKDSKKSLYKLNTRDIFSNLKTFLKQLSEQGRNQYMPSSMEMQVIVGKTKQILQQLYNQAVENGDIEKRHGQTTFISDNKGNVYYLTDKNKPSKMNNVFPIKTGNTSIQESKTQSGIERTTEVEIPDNFVEGEIIDVEYEIINSDIEQNDEIIEVEAEVIENDYDENVEFITVNGILAISDNNDNTISVEQQEQIGKEAKDFFENIDQPKPNQLALLEKNQEEEREKIGEELSKIFNQENNSNTSIIEELTSQLNDVLREKELLEKKSEDVEAKENIPDIIKSLNFAPPSFNPSKPLSNIEKVTKELTEWLQKRLQEQTKKENDLKAEIDKNEATNQKPEIEEVDKGEYPAVLTNISSLEYNYNTSKNTRKAVLNNINEKAMQFFKESGGLEFISSGKLAQLVNSNDKITNVYFKREDGIDGTVFMYVKNGKDYQCIGYLDNAGLQGVLGYNILYPKTQKKNGYYFDHNGIKHKVDISIVDKDGNITPVTSEKYITLKNTNGETLSIGQIFNDRVYQTDLDNLRPVSEINVSNNSFKEALSSGNVSIGYATSESCKDLLSDTTLTNVNKSIAPGSIVVIFNTATNTKMAYPVLSNTPISEWSNRESDEYINFMNDELINLAKAINYIGDSKEFYAKLASFFNNFTNKKFNSIKSKSVVLRTYRKEEIGFFPEMDSTKANVFKIDLCNPESNEVLQTIYIDKTELLKGNLPLAMEERAIAKSIYNQLIHPKILKWNRANKTWEWNDSDNIFYFNLNVRHLSNLDEKAKKDYLSAFSNYIVSDARNFKVDGTFTVVFQSASRRVNDINLSSTRSGTTERQRKAKQSISKFPSLRLGNGVEYEIVPDVDEDKNLLNNSFKLKSTSIDETDNIGYLGNILSYRKFVGSILENPRVTDDLDIKDFNIFTNKILSCIYNYLNTNDDAKLPLYAEYKVENNIMSIPEIGVSINLSNLNISGGDKIGNLLDGQNGEKNTDKNTTQDTDFALDNKGNTTNNNDKAIKEQTEKPVEIPPVQTEEKNEIKETEQATQNQQGTQVVKTTTTQINKKPILDTPVDIITWMKQNPGKEPTSADLFPSGQTQKALGKLLSKEEQTTSLGITIIKEQYEGGYKQIVRSGYDFVEQAYYPDGQPMSTPKFDVGMNQSLFNDFITTDSNGFMYVDENSLFRILRENAIDKQQTGTKSNEKEVKAEKKIEKKNYTNKKTKRKSIGITKGGSVSVKTGEYNAKTFFSDNIEIFKNRKLDSQLLDFIGKNLSNETKVVVISNKEFDEKYGRTTNGLYKVKEHVVVLRESTDMSTIIHEFAHAVTTDLTAAWLENRDAITGKIDSPISTLTEIYYEISRLYNDNPQIFANTNVEYFLNQSDISSKLDEMIGEIFGDKDLQRILKGYEKSLKESTAEYKPKSIFGLIKEFLRKLFRMAGANKVQIEKTINLFDEFKLAVDDLNKISPSNNANGDRFDVNTKETEQEMQSIKEKAIADGTFMKAPNGKPTNLNERQWLQVRTNAFKKWFGDWENKGITVRKSEQTGVYDIYRYGEKIGHFSTGIGEYAGEIGYVTLDKYRGTGLGTNIYVALNRALNESGIVAHSRPNEENSLHEYAQRIWEKLIRQGLAKEVADGYDMLVDNTYSKVVDKNGEPLVVYHYTDNENLNEFSIDFDNYFAQTGGTKKAIFFTEDKVEKGEEDNFLTQRKARKSVFLNIKDLKTYNGTKEDLHKKGTSYREVVNKSAAENDVDGGVHMSGFDDNKKTNQDIWIVHNPNQIKSATDNVGTFSRENDDIRFRIGKKARVEFENKLRKSRPDMSEYEIKETLDFLHKLEDNKENNAFIKTSITWIVNNSITLPEDYEKVRQIFDVARKKNIDTQKYKTFGELMAAPEMQKKEKDKKAFNPDKAKSFSNKQIVKTEGGRVFTVYDVKNTDEGQRDVCHALAAHYETSPWCLSTFTKTGSPTESAKKYWKQYDAIPRKIAFENGKPVAFSSTKRGSSIESVGNIGPYEIFESNDGKYELDSTADLEDVAGLQRAGIITIDNYEDQGIPFSRYILTEKGIERAGIKKKELPNEAWWDMEDRFAQEKLSDNIINKPLDRYVLELQQGPFPQMPTNIHTREEADAWIRENNPEWFNEDVETFQEDTPFFDDISNYMTDEMLDEMYNDFMRAEEERDYNQRQRLFDEYPELEYLSQENIDDFILNEMSNDDSRERLKNILGDEQFERYENLERDKKIDEACRNYNITREEFESQPRERQDLILRCL